MTTYQNLKSKTLKFLPILGIITLLGACTDDKEFNGDIPKNLAAGKPAPGTEDTIVANAPEQTAAGEKPITTDQFSECDKFANASMVADLYSTTEADFHGKYGTKPLTKYVYGTPTKTFCMTNLDIPMRNFSEGFPSFPALQSWFILDIRFTLKVPADGTYTFLLDSDDGSIITVNDQQLINVDGLRDGNQKKVEKATIDLKAGSVQVHYQYFQGPGPDMALQLKWQKPGDAAPEVIPLQYIASPAK